MLTDEIKKTISNYAEGMAKPVSIVLNTGNHDKRQELVNFLVEVAETTDAVNFLERDISEVARSSITFGLEVENTLNGVFFSGIPTGHEFNSFILALLQSGGVTIKLDQQIQGVIEEIPKQLFFETFVSLNCHNCPEVVQAVNQFALLNKNISSEMIDGGLFQEEISKRDIQGVPSVYLNGELFASGRVDVNYLIEKLRPYSKVQKSNEIDPTPLQDVVVIGGGPAGISSAIYVARKGYKVTLVSKNIGGQLKETLGIENFVSVSQTTGTKLASAMQSHMDDYDIEVREHLEVKKIEFGETKEIMLSSGEVLKSRAVIIATGANWKKLGIPGERENLGNGVAYCPHCDGPFYKGKNVAVIGGGNSGIEAALDLSGIVKNVTVFEYERNLNADNILVDRLSNTSNISVITNAETKRILAENGKVIGLEFQDRATGKVILHDLAGIFVQIGLRPNSEPFSQLLELNAHGEIVVDEFCRTSVNGIFACGDVTTVPYKQIIMSMGEGSKAAITAADFLLKNPVRESLVAKKVVHV